MLHYLSHLLFGNLLLPSFIDRLTITLGHIPLFVASFIGEKILVPFVDHHTIILGKTTSFFHNNFGKKYFI
jgi:hypothetical protein